MLYWTKLLPRFIGWQWHKLSKILGYKTVRHKLSGISYKNKVTDECRKYKSSTESKLFSHIFLMSWNQTDKSCKILSQK